MWGDAAIVLLLPGVHQEEPSNARTCVRGGRNAKP
jgi:hypothetical protein